MSYSGSVTVVIHKKCTSFILSYNTHILLHSTNGSDTTHLPVMLGWCWLLTNNSQVCFVSWTLDICPNHFCPPKKRSIKCMICLVESSHPRQLTDDGIGHTTTTACISPNTPTYTHTRSLSFLQSCHNSYTWNHRWCDLLIDSLH